MFDERRGVRLPFAGALHFTGGRSQSSRSLAAQHHPGRRERRCGRVGDDLAVDQHAALIEPPPHPVPGEPGAGEPVEHGQHPLFFGNVGHDLGR
jgi:hypothetical protein